MKIVILSIVPYKEKDAIVEALSQDGEMSFLAKGILDPKNKNAALNNILTVADIETREGNYKYPVLKASSIICNPLKVNNDLDYLSSLLLIAEAIKSLLQDEEKEVIFPLIMETIIILKSVKDIWPIVITYLAKLLKIGGYDFEVNQCVFCGSKQGILTFSFKDGGFVCQNCFEEGMERDLTNPQMLMIRAAFNNQEMSDIKFKCEKEDALVILNKFLEFISDSYGITLKSSSLINK